MKSEKAARIMEKRDQVDATVHRNYHTLAQKFGLSLDQFHLLLELDELNLDVCSDDEAPTIGILAQNVNVTQNTASERVTRLEKKRLVRRMSDSRDRRVSHVLLTGNGKALIAQISAEAETDFLKTALSNMPEEALDRFLSCYDALLSEMDRLAGKGEK